MKLLSLHCDYVRFKPVKKAIKESEELSKEREKGEEVKEALVILTAVESNDSLELAGEYAANIKDIASQVKVRRIVLYPYAHLSSDLGKPDLALAVLEKAHALLEKEGFEVHRAPFGYYKEFELKCKGHPLAELSRTLGKKIEGGKNEVVMGAEKPFDLKKAVASLSRVKLDTKDLKEHDHRILGQKLDLFSFYDAAPGMVFWHEKGWTLFTELVDFWREQHRKLGYREIHTPQLMSNKLWRISGHWDHYQDNMFFVEKDDLGVKPMNCPGAVLVFKSQSRSYRDLPLRLCEMGVVHRRELKGVLGGLLRVQRITQDDAHLFCDPEKIAEEISKVIQLIDSFYTLFGFTYHVELSTRPEKRMGDEKFWDKAEQALEEALKKMKISYKVNKGDGAFYGPKIDFHIKDSQGRTWQCATCQVDFQMPERFGISYIGEDNKEHTPVILHRVLYGALERFIGILLEHYQGKLPLWLSPVQVRLISFTDRNMGYARKIEQQLREAGLRIDSDYRSGTVDSKIRDAELQKINYIVVAGDKEEEAGTVAVRRRGEKKVAFGVKLESFISDLKKEISERR